MNEKTILTLLKIFFIGSVIGVSMMVIGNIAQSYKLDALQKKVDKLNAEKVEK